MWEVAWWQAKLPSPLPRTRTLYSRYWGSIGRQGRTVAQTASAKIEKHHFHSQVEKFNEIFGFVDPVTLHDDRILQSAIYSNTFPFVPSIDY